MTDDVFERRSRRFCEALDFLERMRKTPWEVFEREPEKYASTERFLQIAVEILDDMGTHLVARRHLGDLHALHRALIAAKHEPT